MTEQIMRKLTEVVGISEEDARLRLRDQDLWVVDPTLRMDDYFQGEEGVRLWEEAAHVAQAVSEAVSGPNVDANPAVMQLAWDAAQRARVALRRARQRGRRSNDAVSIGLRSRIPTPLAVLILCIPYYPTAPRVHKTTAKLGWGLG